MFRILEAMDYLYTKELNNAVSLPDAAPLFLKNFVCAFGIFRALHSCIRGDIAIKNMCLIPFLTIVLMRTNSMSKCFSENCQKQLYTTLCHAIDSLNVAENIAVFAIQSNELQLMSEYRKALYCVDVNMADASFCTCEAKKYEKYISSLTTRISSVSSLQQQTCTDAIILRTIRSFLSRKHDVEVRQDYKQPKMAYKST
jgi:hypothetical protein